ncbi:heparin lyase I family protein [Burkholderia anthina]|uniref:Heparin lyase I family protein n=1 Tax=Burkholderia anthina TaxID=179879 RepID=A0A7T6VG25_9BURK|nr:heparin lyase I family protein [Burkholderia anthina]QQK03279.1 heparin lyase I family protein [Burkholderia anthina]
MHGKLSTASHFIAANRGRPLGKYVNGRYFWIFAIWSFFLLSMVRPSFAESVIREPNFDNADSKISDFNGSYRLLSEGGRKFNMPYQGQSAQPQFSNRATRPGGRSLKLTIGPSAPGQKENDRSEFTLMHQGDPAGLRLGESRYIGFSIFFDEKNFPPPSGEIIVSQVWQAYKEKKTGPPAFIVMVPGKDDLSFVLATRDDTSEKSTQVPLGHVHFLRNTWNSVVLHVLPRAVNDPSGPGEIQMWLNGKYLGGAHRPWGYAVPNSVNAFDVRVGLYGNPQPVAHSVWIDQVRWGMTQESVTPN